MLSELLNKFKIGFFLLILLCFLTGVIYPLVVTVIAQVFFPHQANGSLVMQQDQVVGSRLIGQWFNSPYYFWGRPSATTPFPYNSANSSGSNLGPSNPIFLNKIENRIHYLRQADPDAQQLIPVDLVTASASGLDPDISPLAAFYQIPRVAQTNHLSHEQLLALIKGLIQRRSLYVLGEPRVNVLELNMALDKLTSQAQKK